MEGARERISGLTFRPVRNARFALGHSSRSWPKEPSYLLPPAHRLPNRLVYEAVPEPVSTPALEAQNRALRASLEVVKASASTSTRKAAYGALRAFLKGSGVATQASYQALKALHLAESPLVMQWAAALDADQLTPSGLLAALCPPAPPVRHRPIGSN